MPGLRSRTACAAAALVLGVLGTAQVPASGAPLRDGLDPVTTERLDRAIERVMEQADIPGANVGVWIDGRGDYVRSFGTADSALGLPMKTDLYSRLGSVTKTFTVTALLQLVDDGKVGLDDPISRYVDGVPGGDRITVRQLADMRSGLYNYTEDEGLLDTMKADPQHSWTPRQLVDIAFAHPANFPPGTRWEYSNTNTVLLGMLIEKVSGQPLDAYLEQHVFGPAGLNDTSLPSDGAMPSPYAHGYTNFTPDGKIADASNWSPSWAWAAGAAVSDLDDLHRWVPVLTSGKLPGGKRLLEPGTQAQRLRMGATGHPGIGYGLGIAEIDGWIGHNGELPGYESVAVRLPSAGTTLVVLVNADTDKGGNLSSQITAAITKIITPEHAWEVPAEAQPSGPSNPPAPTAPTAPGTPTAPTAPATPPPPAAAR
ncbi:serine hydrolase domain-containing protein [Streptomyces sp. NPDC089799]|uniref:serine hydrolase domain-containing protein n=1 Tax=Streptomyces sp. NPDC089799 TaxID=3155066 RepID=UPI0034372A2C